MKDELDITFKDFIEHIDEQIVKFDVAIKNVDVLIERDINNICGIYFNQVIMENNIMFIKDMFFKQLKQLKLESYKKAKDKLITIKKVLEGSIY